MAQGNCLFTKKDYNNDYEHFIMHNFDERESYICEYKQKVKDAIRKWSNKIIESLNGGGDSNIPHCDQVELLLKELGL